MTETGGGREPVDRLVGEFLERRQRGESVSIDDYVATHPELEEEIRALFPVVEFVEDAVRPSGTRRSGAGSSDTTGLTAETIARLARRGDAFGRYTIEGEVARGGQGAVLCAWDEDLQRRLAMKVVLARQEVASGTPVANSRSVGRFLEEAQVTGQLDHPGIVPVHELGLDADGQVYFTMKLVKGRDLKTIFDLVRAGEEGWTQTRALHVMLRVCEAMAYAHAKGVIHRDLKPGNVMVGKFGEVYVMDWGLARVVGREDAKDVRIRPELTTEEVRSHRTKAAADPDSPLFTMDGDVVGTPAYMSPEQALGDLQAMGPHSDVYAAGAMLYQLLSGQMPYVPTGSRLDNYAIWYQVQKGPPDPLHEIAPETPGELVAICEKAMARVPGARYANMMELAEELQAYLEHRVVGAYRTGALVEFKKWVERNKPLAAALATAVLVLAAGLAVTLVLLRRVATERDDKALALTQARALALANASANEIGEDPVLAVLLAREAVRLEASQESRSRLMAALSSLHERLELDHSNFLASATYSSKGDRILTACNDGIAYLWSADGELLRELPHGGQLRCALFSPDDERILTGSNEGTARLWDGTGRLLRELPPADGIAWGVVTLTASRAAAFSPDGGRLCVGYFSGVARVFDRDGIPLVTLEGEHTDEILCVAFAPNGELNASGSRDGKVAVWDDEGRVRHRFEHGADVSSVSFSPDGEMLLTSSADGTACLWDLDRGSVRESFSGHRGGVYSATFAPDGRLVATSGQDRNVRLWSLDGTQRWSVEYDAVVWSVDFSPDGRLLVGCGADGTARIHDLAGLLVAELHGHGHRMTSAVFSPSAESVLTASVDRTARVWDVLVDDFERFRSGAAVTSGTFSPDGARIATGSFDGTGHVWDGDGNVVSELTAAAGFLDICWSPRGDCLLSCHRDGTVMLWDPTGRSRGCFQVGTAPVSSAAFFPDGSRILIGGQGDVDLGIWELRGDTLERELPFGAASETYDVAVFPDGARVLTGLWQEASLWTPDGQRLHRLRLPNLEATSVAVSPDGRRALIGLPTGEVLLVDTAEERIEEIGRFVIQGKRVNDVAFSPSGDLMVAGSVDGTVGLWHVDGDLLATLRHGGIVWSVAFSPDGTHILSTSSLGTARIWPVPTQGLLLELAAERLTRGFRPEEVAEYAALLDADITPTETVPLTSEGLNTASWEVVSEPGDSAESYAEALRLAERASSLRPEDANILNTLGVAQYRAGLFDQAIETLGRADRIDREATSPHNRAAGLFFLAMASHRLGRVGAAEELLAECRDLMEGEEDPELVGFLREAVELVQGTGETAR